MFHQSVLALIATWEGRNWLKNVAALILLASALQNILYKNQQEYGFSFPMNLFFWAELLALHQVLMAQETPSLKVKCH